MNIIRLGIKISLLFLLFLSTKNLIASSSTGFIENKGQIVDQNYKPNNEVLFLYTGKNHKIQLRKNGYSYEILKHNNLPNLSANKKNKVSNQFSSEVNRIDINFMNCSNSSELILEGKSKDYLNYYINGNYAPFVYSYSKVTYKNIYPFIDMEFILTQDSSSPFKYNIILHPGSNINNIKFMCEGADNIYIENNLLHFKTNQGILKEEIPASYYLNRPNEKSNIQFSLNKNIISFKGNFNPSETFVIDPSTNLVWGTYYGGSSLDYCTSASSDTLNNIYFAGYSLSSNIATAGTHQSTINGSFDAYIAKFDVNGNRMWCTYFGGTSVDVAYAIFALKNGIIYISGDTFSTSNVATPGAHQTTYGGGVDDAILAKFDANGTLIWATYYGGTMHDISQGVVVDNNGDIIMTGHTESANTANVIATSSAYQNFYALNYDVFIVKFNANGVRQWGTYYGDSGVDEAWAITCDATNNIYVTGITNSSFGISTVGSHQTTPGGNVDAFIAKFNPAGTALVWGTYYGGSGDDQGTSMEVNNSVLYVGGNTTSPNNIATPAAHQTTISSADDAMLMAFNLSGTRVWSTYFGGNDVDYINDIVIGKNSDIFFCGSTLSNIQISTLGAWQPNLSTVNFYDAYFAQFSNNGIRKVCTYYGGIDNDNARGIALDKIGKVYIAGETSSSANIATTGAFNTTYSGNGDGFLAKFCVAPEPSISPAGSLTLCANNSFSITTVGTYSAYAWNSGPLTSTLSAITPSVAGTLYYAVTVTDNTGCDGTSDSLTIYVNLCLSSNEITNNNYINIYPIPTSNILHVTSSQNYTQVKVLSIEGKIVLEEKFESPDFEINLQSISEGVYILQLQNDKNTITQKVIKQ